MEMPGILRQEGVKLGGPPVLLARGEGRGGRGRGRANATNTDVDMNAEQEASELEGRSGGEPQDEVPSSRIGVADQKTMLMMIDY